MQYSMYFIGLLIVCSFLTIAAEKKVIFMIPRHVRRSPVASWHPHMRPPPLRKSHYTAEDNYPHLYNRPNSIIYGKPAFRYTGNHPPPGGDDFEQGHEGINNVVIPHGKGISHAISFGRGYIPFDKIKGNFSPLKEENSFAANYRHKDQSEEDSFSPIDPSHISLTTESDGDSFLPDQNGSYDLELNENLEDDSKLFNSRSISKNTFGAKIPVDNANSASAEEKKSLIPTDVPTASLISQTETTTVPIFVPSPKIAGSTRGVVIRDSVSLDDYNKKVEEFTKTWPGVINIPGIHGSNIQHIAQTTGIQQLPLSSFAASSFPAALPWTSSLTGNQGYSVREDIGEPEYDFRTMPIQNTQVHSFPTPGNAVLPNIQNSYG